MATVEDLLNHFRRQVALPWTPDTPPDYRIWIMHYDKALERRVQAHLHQFEAAARATGHGWSQLDLAALVAPWLGRHELFEALADQPDELPGLLPEFEEYVAEAVRGRLATLGEKDVLVLTGVGALFGLTRASALAEAAAPSVRGRLLLLFPGRHQDGVYRLLDARDGWSYRATPIPP